MKKFFFAAIAAVALTGSFASCSNDDVVDGGAVATNDNSIAFSISTEGGKATRGIPTTPVNYLERIPNFLVWAYYTNGATGTGVTPGGRYVGLSDTEGIQVDQNGFNLKSTSSWGYADRNQTQYWPATTAPLNFQAITPIADESFTVQNEYLQVVLYQQFAP